MKILCGGAQCGEYLGDVGPSGAQLNPYPVWRIQPGWRWAFPPGTRGEPIGCGILERVDDTHRSERRLLHEVYGNGQAIQSALSKTPQVGVAREANLPVVVRCPKCHRLRYVPADVVTQNQSVERRLIQIART